MHVLKKSSGMCLSGLTPLPTHVTTARLLNLSAGSCYMISLCPQLVLELVDIRTS